MSSEKNNYLDISSIDLRDIIDIDFLQKFQDDFAVGMGLACVTVDTKGNPHNQAQQLYKVLHGFLTQHR